MKPLPKTCSDCSHYAHRIDDHGSYWSPAHCKKDPTPIGSLTERPVVLGGFSDSPPDWCPLRLEEVEAEELAVASTRRFNAAFDWLAPKMTLAEGCSKPTERHVAITLRDASRVECPICKTPFGKDHTVHDFIKYRVDCACELGLRNVSQAFDNATVRMTEAAKTLGLLPKFVCVDIPTPKVSP